MRHEEEEDLSSSPRKRAKLTTVYDAVAGRANYEGFLSLPRNSRYRDRASTTLVPIPPGEVLFRREDAPERYEEDDIYTVDRRLDQKLELQRLPDSDLLKALHAYTSDFYAGIWEDAEDDDFESLDETALLALGVLVEEAAAQIPVEDVASLPEELDSKQDTTDDASSVKGDIKTKIKTEIKTDGDAASVRSIKAESDDAGVNEEIKSEGDSASLANGIKVEPDD